MWSSKFGGKNKFILPLVVLLMVVSLYLRFSQSVSEPVSQNNIQPKNISQNLNSTSENSAVQPAQQNMPVSRKPFGLPIADAQNRITKKPFGIKITPATSPVQPERFSGYHTGTDFETTPSEANQEIIISAICGGQIIFANWVSGYGNVLVEACTLNNQSVTIIYGHLSFGGSVVVKNGATVKAGESIAVLGAGQSHDTDGERKHLHLGIHKGALVNVRGYVVTAGELAGWINPQDVLDWGQ